MRQLVALVLFSALLAGCATRTPETSYRNLPARIELTATPFFPQDDHQCGPAALATALVAAGYTADPRKLAQQVYLPAREGSLQAEMISSARRQGALALPAPRSLDALFSEISAGQPVIVLQNLGIDLYPRWHYAVIVGYDLNDQAVILRSGRTKRETMSLRTFEHTWSRSNHWGLLVLPPGQLPLQARLDSTEQALAQLEKHSGPADMVAWYEKAAQRWPESLPLMIGLGNALHAEGRLNDAEYAFREASAMHPDSVVALNNFAAVLQEQGKLEQALAVADHAVALGGEWHNEAKSTRNDILTAIRHGSRPPPPRTR